MKSLRKKLKKLSTLSLLACCAVLFTPLQNALAQASEASTDSIALMASALRLKDQGQTARAYEAVVRYLEVDPTNGTALRLRSELIEQMEAEGISYDLISTDEVVDVADDSGTVVVEAESVSVPSMRDVRRAARSDDYETAIEKLAIIRENSTDSAQISEIDQLTAQYLMQQENISVDEAIATSRRDARRATQLASDGRYTEAHSLLDSALGRLPNTAATEREISRIQETKRSILLDQAEELAAQGQAQQANQVFQRYSNNPSPNASTQRRAAEIRSEIRSPYAQNLSSISPGFAEKTRRVDDLLLRGRAQFVGGDVDGARQTFALAETIDPNNIEAKAFLYEIAQRQSASGYIDRAKTREEMLNQVSRAWQQPRVYVEDRIDIDDAPESDQVLAKLENIIIPRVTFSGTSLPRAVQSLSQQSEEFDRTGEGDTRGVNMVVTQGGQDREVNFSVRNLSLLRILDIVAQQTGYQWDVVDNVVEFNPSEQRGANARLQRAIIPIAKGTLDLILDIQQSDRRSVADDPFSAPSGGASGPSTDERGRALQDFFTSSGINFDIPGASIVNRGSRLLVNQTSRNIEEIRQTLRELDVTDQVEIEAKFMEVVQGNLDELGFQWDVGTRGSPLVSRTSETISGSQSTSASGQQMNATQTSSGPPPVSSFTDTRSQTSSSNQSSFNDTVSLSQPQYDRFGNPAQGYRTEAQNHRSTLASIFSTRETTGGSETILVNGENVGTVAPGNPPSALDLAADITTNLLSTSGVIGQFDVSLLIRAISRMEGSDLLSAPRVTVMSGKSANIVVAQEFRYPERFSEPTVSAPSGNGGAASIGVTSGVPEDFTTRNLGVELTVTPTVEPNEKINLNLNPRVTEFEGFVSYGGPNIALAGNQQVIAPSGYFQPIFSTRSVETEVTVFDGATVVLGGLTREEVKQFKEKVPILGDIPFVGRLFRSEGETAQKMNLIIFVTANLVSPGGSPAKQTLEDTRPNSLFQNPTLISPGGILSRDRPAAPTSGN
jgi:general secretion pathway protein D